MHAVLGQSARKDLHAYRVVIVSYPDCIHCRKRWLRAFSMSRKLLTVALLLGLLLLSATAPARSEEDDYEDDAGDDKEESAGSDDEKDVKVITTENWDEVVKKAPFALVRYRCCCTLFHKDAATTSRFGPHLCGRAGQPSNRAFLLALTRSRHVAAFRWSFTRHGVVTARYDGERCALAAPAVVGGGAGYRVGCEEAITRAGRRSARLRAQKLAPEYAKAATDLAAHDATIVIGKVRMSHAHPPDATCAATATTAPAAIGKKSDRAAGYCLIPAPAPDLVQHRRVCFF